MPSTNACQILRIPIAATSVVAPEAAADDASAIPARSPERVAFVCDCMIDIASALFNVSGRELRQPGRASTSVSRVRQIAMYVTHVVMGLTMAEVGRGFGRDRTTVLHACHLIEDMRDDADFDAIVALTERVAGAALRGLECR
ncbi:MAG: helix-turn-helix domain-containing protein [Mesorhizobium sp.]